MLLLLLVTTFPYNYDVLLLCARNNFYVTGFGGKIIEACLCSVNDRNMSTCIFCIRGSFQPGQESLKYEISFIIQYNSTAMSVRNGLFHLSKLRLTPITIAYVR